MADDLLTVEDLSVAFPVRGGWLDAVRSVSLSVRRGETVALVGESGSGKTVTSMGVIGLVGAIGGRISGGRIRFDGRDITELPEKEWLGIRGAQIGMIFQQPTRSLDPAFTVGDQIAEGVRVHHGVSRRAAWARAVEMLDRVQIPDAERRAREYPHTFSGGMCQRVMIAMALACEPQLLIADEPTTALDVTVQAKILDLLREIQVESGIAVLYITHDLGVVRDVCERVAVMYAGEIVETGAVDDLFVRPRHPYSAGLMAAIPRPGGGKRMATIAGQVPSPAHMPTGCSFHPRCAHARRGTCDVAPLGLEVVGSGAAVRCARSADLVLAGTQPDNAR